ncbi:MAG TPA: TolC family protein [Pirellulales bacterium]|nr:TolC family protein [Pirellulales bacterium]
MVAVLMAGCASPRAEVPKAPIVPVSNPSAADGPTMLPATSERVESPQIEALPALTEPIAASAPVSIEQPNASPSETRSQADLTGRPLTLDDAVALAFERQSRLRVYLEGVQQARGLSDIAFAPFLPTLATGYSVGAYNLNVGGLPITAGSVPGFTVVPPGFALPVGLNLSTGYELAEMRLQWLICDFGRRLGRYNAAKLGIDIRQLQTDRAYQTVANEVALAYYDVLRTQAFLRIAQEAVLRDVDERDVAQKLTKGGAIEREKLLRAEVQLAETHRLQDASEEAVAVANAALNLAIGLKRNEPVQVVEPTDIPEFAPSLAECLEMAVTQRKEFQVARRSIEVAQEGTRVARADFAPRVVGEGDLFDLHQAELNGRADIALGFIKLEWNIFEGGKRVAELRVADSKVREAINQAESIADTIAFQVNQTYRHLATARLGIDRARPAVEQATENYRLVRARAADGDATPSEITDAATALTRAQQNYLNSRYEYLSAIAKLNYATGAGESTAMMRVPQRKL